jgi:hypothetical protein
VQNRRLIKITKRRAKRSSITTTIKDRCYEHAVLNAQLLAVKNKKNKGQEPVHSKQSVRLVENNNNKKRRLTKPPMRLFVYLPPANRLRGHCWQTRLFRGSLNSGEPLHSPAYLQDQGLLTLREQGLLRTSFSQNKERGVILAG